MLENDVFIQQILDIIITWHLDSRVQSTRGETESIVMIKRDCFINKRTKFNVPRLSSA